MTIFSDIYKKIVDDQYIQALKDDNIKVPNDVIEKAKQGDREAIHTIGCAYIAIGNDKKVDKWLGTSSAMGFSESQLELGCYYLTGSSKNTYKARRWLRNAADNNIKSAVAYEGDIDYEEEDYIKAHEMFQKSADLGDAYGQNRLGEFYTKNHRMFDDLVFEQNYHSAMKMFRKAADQGYPKAYYNIGVFYEYGRGVKINEYEAIRWYMKSNNGGYKPAAEGISYLNTQGFFYFPTEDESKEFTDLKYVDNDKDKSPPAYDAVVALKSENQKSGQTGN